MEGWLSRTIEEIVKCESFVCHKNNDLQCAGHMILCRDRSLFMRFAVALRIDLNLSGHDLVFETVEDCILHHKK